MKEPRIYLSGTFARKLIGLRQVSDRLWDIYFGPIKLAQLDTYERRIIHLLRKPKRRNNKDDKKEQNQKEVLPMYLV